MEKQAERTAAGNSMGNARMPQQAMMLRHADGTVSQREASAHHSLSAGEQSTVNALAKEIHASNNGNIFNRAKEFILSFVHLDNGWRALKKLEGMMKAKSAVAMYCIQREDIARTGPRHHKRRIAHVAAESSMHAARFAISNYETAKIATNDGWTVAHTVVSKYPNLQAQALADRRIANLATRRGDTVFEVALYYRKLMRASGYVMRGRKELIAD